MRYKNEIMPERSSAAHNPIEEESKEFSGLGEVTGQLKMSLEEPSRQILQR
jgi:hypothetical protein